MDWLAKLVALSYLLSRYLSLTTLRLPQNYYWYNSKFIKKIKKKLSTVNISLTQHPSAMKYIQGLYCQYLSVVGNWDHWWTYDGISGPGISFKKNMLLNNSNSTLLLISYF